MLRSRERGGDSWLRWLDAMDEACYTTDVEAGNYPFVDLLREVISPGAVGALTQLADRIHEIYGLNELLDAPLPRSDRAQHAEALARRLQRVIRLLPVGVSPTPNEVFTAIEFLIYEVEKRPVLLGEAIMRLEALAEEIRERPLLHDLVTGRAN